MTRWFLLVSVLVAVSVTVPVAAEGPPATPTAPAATPHIVARTSYTAFLRSEPARAAGTDRAVIPVGTAVEVLAVVADESAMLGGYWYQVRAFPADVEPMDGWMHSTIIYLAPDQLAQLSGQAPGGAAAAPTADGAASAAPVATAVPPTPTQAATLAVPLALRVCYDLHANKTCDVDEGIANVMVYGTDAATGQILLAGATDATGLARLVWQTPADDNRAQLTLTVPYFQEVRTVQATATAVEPVLITQLAPIPAWLP